MKGKVKAILITVLVAVLSLSSLTLYAAEKMAISNAPVKLNIGEEFDLDLNDEFNSKSQVWSSSNENIVSVSKTGVIKALKKGKVTIKARVGRDYASCKVEVVNPSIKINKKSATIYHGGTSQNTVELKATPNGATKKLEAVEWKSSDENVAIVTREKDKKGKEKVIVTGKSAGTATITAPTV